MNGDQLLFIKQSLNIYGYALVGPIKDMDFNKEAINEIINHLENQPRIKNMEIKIDKIASINKEELKKLKSSWVPYAQSGKVHEPPAFHMSKLWEIRQSEELYQIFSSIIGDKNLRVSLDCYEAKLPKEGQNKRLFWNQHPYNFNLEEETYNGLYALNQLSFNCIPGSHTIEFYKSLRYYYPYVWSTNKSQIDLRKDPWNLQSLEMKIIIPPGYILIWNDKLLRSKYVNLENRIKFGYHINYKVASSISRDEDKDRIKSFVNGSTPSYNFNGRNINYMPKAWYCFPNKVKEYWKRLPPEQHQYRISKNNTKLPCILEPVLENYNPPKLTDLGNRLLWGKSETPLDWYK